MRIPKVLAYLFWDCDPNSLDPHEHAIFVLDRLMSHTDEHTVAWLRVTYPTDVLLGYLYNEGTRKLGPCELEYWCATLDVDETLRNRWLAAAQARMHRRRAASP